MLLGKGLVIGARFCSFTLFIVLNAVICTVGVFNLALANEAGTRVDVDGYLIFVSALALISIIPLIFIDTYVKDPFVCRLWVECTWVGIFWVLELVAAAAYSAIAPGLLCNPKIPEYIRHAACQSTQALQACTWLVMIILFGYLALLVSCGIRHERLAPNVWQTSVRHFPWFDENPRVEYPDPAPPYRQRRRSAPVMSPRQMMQPPTLEAPRPRHAIPRLRLTIPVTVRDVMGRIGRPSPSPSIREPQSAAADAMVVDPSSTNAPAVPPSRASRRSFLSFTRSRRSSRRPSSRRPYDPEAFYPEHLQAALSSIVYNGSSEQPPAALMPGRTGRRGSRPLPQAQAVGGPSSWQEPRPPVPPLPDLGSMSSRRPLPSPAPLTAPLPVHIAPSRPQLTIDTSNSGLHPTPAPAFGSTRRGSRPLPQLLHTKAAPQPQPQPVAGPSRLNIPPPPPLLATPVFADPTPTSASISPLADWPRTDVLSLPLRPRKRAPPPPPSSFPILEETSASSHAPLLSSAGVVRRDSGGSEPTPTSSSAAHGTMGQPPSVGPSPRGSLSSRVVLPPRGPRTRQESLSSLNSVQLHNLVSNAYGQDHFS